MPFIGNQSIALKKEKMAHYAKVVEGTDGQQYSWNEETQSWQTVETMG